MSDETPQLIPVRQLHGYEPVIIQPYAEPLWGTTKRLRRCEIWAFPEWSRDCAGFVEMEWAFRASWWTSVFKRDVTLWPVDQWSGALFAMVVNWHAQTPRRKRTFKALRWAWGHPFAEELGEPQARIETLWDAS